MDGTVYTFSCDVKSNATGSKLCARWKPHDKKGWGVEHKLVHHKWDMDVIKFANLSFVGLENSSYARNQYLNFFLEKCLFFLHSPKIYIYTGTNINIGFVQAVLAYQHNSIRSDQLTNI